MQVQVESEFEYSAQEVWQTLLSSSSFQYIIQPLVVANCHQPNDYPERWQQGQTIVIKPYLFGFIPLPLKQITFETIACQTVAPSASFAAGFIQTRESDAMIKVWDHTIEVVSLGQHKTKYRDTIDIQAGVLTPFVCAFAHWFYRHRQKRWLSLLKSA